MSDARAAAREAKQEAVIIGKISKEICGSYRYRKVGKTGWKIVEVRVYMLRVRKEKKTWRERRQRHRMWFDKVDAARKVRERGLKGIILNL